LCNQHKAYQLILLAGETDDQAADDCDRRADILPAADFFPIEFYSQNHRDDDIALGDGGNDR